MLSEKLPENRLSAGKSLLRRGSVSSFLKLSALCILLFAVLCMLPVSASPLDGEVLPSAERDLGETAELERMNREAVLDVNPHFNSMLPVTPRELKQRSSQKKLLSPEYQSYAENGHPVLFAESPVVTGMSLPDGVSGVVHLLTRLDDAGPKCREVYDVFELSLDNYPQGLEAVIRYTIPLEEIEESGNSPGDISLYFSDGENWEKLPTEYYMDSSQAFFESVTTSLGVFAIVLDECESEVESVHLPSRSLESGKIMLDISPVCILTHPVSYTVIAD